MKIPELTAQEVAAFIQNGDTVALGGFSPSGTPKTIMPAVAQKAMKEHEEGREFKIHLNAGASVGDSCDGTLVRADAVISRIPYCDNKDMRKAYNGGKLKFCDLNLTDSAAFLRPAHNTLWRSRYELYIRAAEIHRASADYQRRRDRPCIQ
jgi:acyl-CoA hydrolase